MLVNYFHCTLGCINLQPNDLTPRKTLSARDEPVIAGRVATRTMPSSPPNARVFVGFAVVHASSGWRRIIAGVGPTWLLSFQLGAPARLAS